MSYQVFKVLFLGESGVGKSSLIDRYFNDKFDEKIIKTLSTSSLTKEIKYSGRKYHFKIFDTPGKQDLRDLTKNIMKDVRIVILVYDITVKSSFLELQYWLDLILESHSDTHLILVGNKHDLSINRKIKESVGLKFAEIIKAEFTEISAKDNYGWKNFLDNAFNNYIVYANKKEEDEEKEDYLSDDFDDERYNWELNDALRI